VNLNGPLNLNGILGTNLNFTAGFSNTPNLGGNYKAIAMTGGNSVGYLYGAWNSLGDGVHLSYNYINCNLGGGSSTCNLIPNAGGNTTQLSVTYNAIRLGVGAINTPPSTVMMVTAGGMGINCEPAQALDVNGNANIRSNLNTSNLNASTFSVASGGYGYFNNATGYYNAFVSDSPFARSSFQLLTYVPPPGGFYQQMLTVTPTARIGILCNAPRYTLDVQGDINVSGAVRVNNVALTSDQRVKKNIVSADVSRCFSTMKSIDLKYFKWDPVFQSTSLVRDTHQLGFVAQEIKPVFPNSVLINSTFGFDDFHVLDHHQLQTMHFGATKHLGSVVETQSTQIAALLSQVSTMNDAISYIPQLVSTLKGLGH
jgi:hypothetical protein